MTRQDAEELKKLFRNGSTYGLISMRSVDRILDNWFCSKDGCENKSRYTDGHCAIHAAPDAVVKEARLLTTEDKEGGKHGEDSGG